MGKYKTKAEREHMRRVSELGCIICGGVAELHHPRTGVGMGQRSSHFSVLPLCFRHHRTGKDSIHLGKKLFIEKFGTEEELLIKVKGRLECDQGIF
tara:strand:+ start:1779 stop:2066 length:288 start_codon:yes stop_codon:yes gene_type:complete